MHVSGRMITDPRQKHVAASPDLAHRMMLLPYTVAFRNVQ